MLNRDDLLISANAGGDTSNDIPFVFTNNSANPNLVDSIRRATEIMFPSERMRKVMNGRKIIAAKRQPHNIRSMLFRPRFDPDMEQTKGSVKPCREDPNRKAGPGQPCRCCNMLEVCSSITFHRSTEPFEIRHRFTCDTSNLIYTLTCGSCGLD